MFTDIISWTRGDWYERWSFRHHILRSLVLIWTACMPVWRAMDTGSAVAVAASTASWGAAADSSVGDLSLSSAAAYDEQVHRGNGYLRLGKEWENGSAAGISVGAGRGLLFGTPHDLAVAADAIRRFGRCKLMGEALEACSGKAGPVCLLHCGVRHAEPVHAVRYVGIRARQQRSERQPAERHGRRRHRREQDADGGPRRRGRERHGDLVASMPGPAIA